MMFRRRGQYYETHVRADCTCMDNCIDGPMYKYKEQEPMNKTPVEIYTKSAGQN